jgi:PRTRC genetic system ThiF family protein
MYRLYNHLVPQYRHQALKVGVVGCGGTGGFVAEGLCRLLDEEIVIILVDHDTVEERNLVRQNFFRDELGLSKSEALSRRLCEKYNRRIGYLTSPISMIDLMPEIIIGCVDNGMARRDIAAKATTKWQPNTGIQKGWWIDAGNDTNFGQVLIGNAPVNHLKHAFETKDQVCYALPLPTEQRPELLLELPRPAPACAEAVARDEQSATINQVMGALVLEVVRRILNGSCSWMQLSVDMDNGTMNPTLATPENVATILKVKARGLTYEREEKERS